MKSTSLLIVEDSPTQAEQLRNLLEQNGYQVSVARQGIHALELMSQHKPNLIITDINMPEMNGYELCKHIKESEIYYDIPVILLTSLSNPDDVLGGLECGADSFITKPFNSEYFLANIQQILASWKLHNSDRVRIGVEIFFGGKRRFISADQQQMLGLLLSTYEAAVQRNNELIRTQDELSVLNENLEGKIEERTLELVAENAERKRVEAQLRQVMIDLQLSYKELEEFAYVASHDLQEPLRLVVSYVQLLSQRYKGQLDDEADEFIKYAVDGSLQMKSLIEDSLKYIRVGMKGHEIKPIPSQNALDTALRNMGDMLKNNQVIVTHDALPEIMVDKNQLVMLFENLIENAIKFRSSEIPHIHISAQPYIPPEDFPEEPAFQFCVQDNGIGINPAHFGRIFVIFQRLHPRETYGGNGTGLAICKKIIDRHNGKIWVESQPGQGSAFFFTLRAVENE